MGRSRKIKAGDARRAKVILRLAKGESYQRIALLEGCGAEFITRWRKRFEAERLGGLYARHRGRIVSDKVLSQEAKKATSSSRPKTLLPVTGNLATEIFFGAGLVGGLRARTREAVKGIFCRL